MVLISDIITFTYFIGISIAILTKQIKLNDFVIMGAIFVISIGVLGICSTLFFNAIFHLKNIPQVSELPQPNKLGYGFLIHRASNTAISACGSLLALQRLLPGAFRQFLPY